MVQIGKPGAKGGADLARILGQNAGADPAKTTTEESKAHRSREDSSSAGKSSERIEISPEARVRAEREEALQVIREAYRGLEGIRRDVVDHVRQKIDAGYYDREDVLQQLADRLLSIIKS